ncbi:adenosylhomocysteinase 3 isoform X2 [Biomphalaria glabrata]|nr:adenosylhomocysteinase 3 isoform X2 [Biomphalaria glabrata]
MATKGPELSSSGTSSTMLPMLSRSRRPSAMIEERDVKLCKEIKYNLTPNRPRIRSRSVSQSSTDSYSSELAGYNLKLNIGHSRVLFWYLKAKRNVQVLMQHQDKYSILGNIFVLAVVFLATNIKVSFLNVHQPNVNPFSAELLND